MKYEKPIEECAISPGKLISAFPGFVGMWNWLMQTVFHFAFGPGLAVSEDELGHKMAYLNVEWGDGFEVETDEESNRVFVSCVGGGGEGIGSFKYDKETGLVGGGAVCLGRKFVKVEPMETPVTDGSVRLKITYGQVIAGTTVEIEIGDGFEDPTNEVGYIPLYDIAEGEIVEDYRGAPVHVIRS